MKTVLVKILALFLVSALTLPVATYADPNSNLIVKEPVTGEEAESEVLFSDMVEVSPAPEPLKDFMLEEDVDGLEESYLVFSEPEQQNVLESAEEISVAGGWNLLSLRAKPMLPPPEEEEEELFFTGLVGEVYETAAFYEPKADDLARIEEELDSLSNDFRERKELSRELVGAAAEGRSMGGEADVSRIFPAGYWEMLKDEYVEKKIREREILQKLKDLGIKSTAAVERVLKQDRPIILHEIGGHENRYEPFHINILAALFKADKAGVTNLEKILNRKGIAVEDFEGFEVREVPEVKFAVQPWESANAFEMKPELINIGRGKGTTRNVDLVILKFGPRNVLLAGVIDKKPTTEFGISESAKEYSSTLRAREETSLVADSYLFDEIDRRGILFREYLPGIDVDDWFAFLADSEKKGMAIPTPDRMLEEVTYKLGRMFGTYYHTFNGWPEDMHLGNVVISYDPRVGIDLKMIDHTDFLEDDETIAYQITAMLGSYLPEAFRKIRKAPGRFYGYFLAGLESTFEDDEDFSGFVRRLNFDYVSMITGADGIAAADIIEDYMRTSPGELDISEEWDRYPAAEARAMGERQLPYLGDLKRVVPAGYFEDPRYKGRFVKARFHRKTAAHLRMFKDELKQRGVEITPEIEMLLKKTRIFNVKKRGREVQPFHLDLLEGLLRKDPESGRPYLIRILKHKGISPEDLESINLQNINFDFANIGQDTGQTRQVDLIILNYDGKKEKFIGAVDRYVVYELEKSPSYKEFKSASEMYKQSGLVAEPYVFLTKESTKRVGSREVNLYKGMVFREYLPGINLYDWFENMGVTEEGAGYTEQLVYKLGRIFGAYYQRTGSWPMDMHTKNVIVSVDPRFGFTLKMTDHTGYETAPEEISYDLNSYIRYEMASLAGLLAEGSAEKTRSLRETFALFFLRGFESTFEGREKFDEKMEDFKEYGWIGFSEELKTYKAARDEIKIKPEWDLYPAEARAMGRIETLPIIEDFKNALALENLPENLRKNIGTTYRGVRRIDFDRISREYGSWLAELKHLKAKKVKKFYGTAFIDIFEPRDEITLVLTYRGRKAVRHTFTVDEGIKTEKGVTRIDSVGGLEVKHVARNSEILLDEFNRVMSGFLEEMEEIAVADEALSEKEAEMKAAEARSLGLEKERLLAEELDILLERIEKFRARVNDLRENFKREASTEADLAAARGFLEGLREDGWTEEDFSEAARTFAETYFAAYPGRVDLVADEGTFAAPSLEESVRTFAEMSGKGEAVFTLSPESFRRTRGYLEENPLPLELQKRAKFQRVETRAEKFSVMEGALLEDEMFGLGVVMSPNSEFLGKLVRETGVTERAFRHETRNGFEFVDGLAVAAAIFLSQDAENLNKLKLQFPDIGIERTEEGFLTISSVSKLLETAFKAYLEIQKAA